MDGGFTLKVRGLVQCSRQKHGVLFFYGLCFEIGTQKKGKSNGPENLPGGAPGPVQSLKTVE